MYEDFYGLTGRPFQLTPDPAFYFESATHRKALSYLGYGLAQGEGFIVVTGEVGAGKSTLVAHLLEAIDPQRLTAAQIVTTALDGAEMVHVAAQAFGIGVAGKDKASALKAIEQFLHAEARAGRRCLLVVDEAQNLSVDALEELRMLSNFQLGSHPLLQTLLLGQPEFRDTLADSPALEQLRQRVIANHHLEAMDQDEVGPYVEHRLAKVGWAGNPGFEDGVFAGLAAASHGIPRRINQLVARLLLMGAVEQRERIDEGMLDKVVADLGGDQRVERIRPADAEHEEAAVAFPRKAERHPEPEFALVSPNVPLAGLGEIEAAFERRDAIIMELQEAMLELSDAAAAPAAAADADNDRVLTMLAALDRRVAGIEDRLSEQEQTLRHTLTMLIEWFEDDGSQARAA